MQRRKYQPLGKILGSIAQEYNSILALIEGHAHMLERQLGPDLLNHDSLQSITAATERGYDLTQRLIQLDSFPADTAERGDLVATIRHNRILFKSILGIGSDIQIHIPAQPIYIPLCEEGITQILISAFLDARTRRAGHISIAASIAGHHATLHITDNGTTSDNTPPDYLSDEWHMVHEWVETANGSMQTNLDSQGGTLTILFPLAIQSANPFADKTILVVDEDAGSSDLIAQYLDPFGVRILRASNSEQALILQQQSPHPVNILMTPVQQDKLNGPELAQLLAAHNPALNVIYMTDISDDADQEFDFLKQAITLPKPFSLRKLSASLEKALQSVQKMSDQDGQDGQDVS